MHRLGLRTVLVAIGCVAIAGGLAVGISDNPPGIALVYGGLVCLVLAAASRWRGPRTFALLLVGSIVGFVAFAVLHNLLYALGEMTELAWLKGLTGALHATAFLIAVLLCPVGVLVGVVGSIAALVRGRGDRGATAG
jgi:hypothetical protein